jgi:pimeloyl-ACP methyl ester carboxylesterase
MGVELRQIETNGLSMRIAEEGPADGPVVLLCHGFPESWYSWRHQLPALAEAGYRAVAPDMRGYGGTDAPADPHAYSAVHHLGDMVGLLDALGVGEAAIVGHDWGSPVAWTCAQLRPDRFRAVASLAVPWAPRSENRPTSAMKALFADTWFYFLYFQEPGRAEGELDPNVEPFLRGFLYSISGDPPPQVLRGLAGGPVTGTMLEHLEQPDVLPWWLTAEDLGHYVAEFSRTGFRGGLSWYRSVDTTWELTRGFADLRIEQPALFVAGDREPVLAMMPGAAEAMGETVPGLRDVVMLPGCGHWTQQERPAEVNGALLAFLGAAFPAG